MRALLLAALLVAGALGSTAARAQGDDDRVQRAVDALLARDLAGVGPAYAAQALQAARLDPTASPAGAPVLDRIEIEASTEDRPYKALLQAAYAVGVSGVDPRDFHGHDLVALVRAGFRGAEFGQVEYVMDDAFAILALRAAGVPSDDDMIQRSAASILAAQAPDGGWGYTTVAVGSWTDTTGMALVALRSAGVDLTAQTRAAAFLESTRDPTGGYRESKNGARNLQSTLWALHARHALGLPDDPAAEAYVRSLQLADGTFRTGRASQPDGNAWATAEAVVYLAGGRHPLPGFVEPAIELRPALPGSPSVLSVGPAFRDATWELDGVVLRGARVEHALRAYGAYEFRVHAVGEQGHARAEGVLHVPSLPPVARLAQATVEVDRHALVRPDLGPSIDPDGRIVAAEADWGEGVVEEAAPGALARAFAFPGEHVVRLRVRDDAGAWSAPVELTVRVRDRAPQLALPERLLADRVAPLRVPVAAMDPDGDPVALRWWVEDANGTGAPSVRFSTLGARTLRVVAEDPYGARAEATSLVEVVNLAPEVLWAEARIAPDGAVDLVAAAADADGPTPRLAWTLDGTPLDSARARVGPGTHRAEVVATDADGATARRAIVFAVGEPVPVPRVERVDVRFTGGLVVVEYVVTPAVAQVALEWTSDGGDGAMASAASPAALPLANATHARVRVIATLGERSAEAEASVVRRGASTGAPPLLLETDAATLAAGQAAQLRATAAGARAYRFDFGDGNGTEWGAEPRAGHVYAAPGLYAVVAQARSAEGAVSSASGTILVHAAPEAVRQGADEREGGAMPVPTPAGPAAAAEPGPLPAPAEARAQTPAPPVALALALALLLARRRRRAASA